MNSQVRWPNLVDHYIIECERQAKTATHVIPQTLPDALRLAAEMAEKVQHLSLVNKEQKTEIDCLKNLFQVGMSPVQFCKQLNGVNINQVNLFLESCHFLYDAEKDISKAHVWRVHSYARDTYLTESPFIMTNDYGQRQCYKVVLLKKGASWLYNQYLKSKLPMKKDWNGEFTHDKYSQVA